MSLARDLEERRIAVALLHPGMVATDMTGGGGVSPEQSAGGLIKRMDALAMTDSGSFWHAEGERLPWEVPCAQSAAECYFILMILCNLPFPGHANLF